MRTAMAAAAVMLGSVAALVAASARPQVQTVPAGTQLNVLLQTSLNSGTAKAEQRFEAASIEDWRAQGQVVLAAGVVMRGFVSSVRPAGKSDGGQLTLSFDEVRIGDRALRLRASVVSVLDPKLSADARRLVTGSVVGASASFGMVPLSDVTVNPGGTIVAVSGSDVKLPVGVVLRIRLDQPLEVPTER
jgi:hypothetical protein